MRNRGIEIYMFNEKENGVNDFDLKSLIDMKGLKDTTFINTLINIHNFIGSCTLGMCIYEGDKHNTYFSVFR